jgi:hypothetical protein
MKQESRLGNILKKLVYNHIAAPTGLECVVDYLDLP